MLSLTVVASAALGFGGGFLAKNLSSTTTGNVTINQVSSGAVTNASSVSASTTSDIVKKTADSVVEIATEGITTGSFARQYVTQGAGSGVIISADGYIVTNHHVIDGANTITVTLRDGNTTYDATLIGSDEDNDIALIKISAEGLSPATFGDSASLAVGDYVVAIGNPLGTLGGTVTDGIISALAREVTIEDKNMTLLQTNAQISPGNSGGGLFNANGELVGIVNAKDSATEVEGIAFAIPVNNVIDIIKDLQNYGYVTGKIDMGMEFVDINSNDTAFYYGVNELGCYVLSVNSGSNAESAGFKRGDLIVSVNGTNVSTQADISKALENNKVGDEVTLTVKRNGQTQDIKLTLAEYKPSAKLSESAGSDNSRQRQSGSDDFWDQIFGW
ncbi:MAG: trypsin-like peptidase domain-containing protein [Ruminococcus sp.]|nr:trypsin-like peptidase domain-containing protein [Ruminococcus sp.]